MLSSLTLTDLGPVEGSRDVTLQPAGPTVITAPSQWGKSTVTAALLAALLGDALNVRRGADKGAVKVQTAKGNTLTITETGRGSWRCAYTRSGEEHRGTTKADLLGFWTPRFACPTARYVVAPMAWRELTAGTAEPLRDLLTSVLPPVDVGARVRAILGDLARDTDPADIAGGLALQRQANAAKDRAAGRLDATAAALHTAEAQVAALVTPEESAVTGAQATVEADGEWDAYDRAAAAWTAYDEALARWTANAPTDAPAYDAEAHQAARRKVERIREEEQAERQRQAVAEAEERARLAAEAKAERERVAAEERAAAAERARIQAERVEAETRAAREAAAVAVARQAEASALLFPALPEVAPAAPVVTTCPLCGKPKES